MSARRADTEGGTPLNREFAAAQEVQLGAALDLIDTTLFFHVRSAALLAALREDVRPMVARHLGQARGLRAALTGP